jgi:glucose uptake protein GlcU
MSIAIEKEQLPLASIDAGDIESIDNNNSEVSDYGGRSDAAVLKLSFALVLVAAVLIAIMLSIAYLGGENRSSAGWVAVAGASIIFGTTGIPMKSPSLKNFKIDSFVFALFTGFGIFSSAIPLIIYLWATGTLKFRYFGILGAVNIFIVSYFAYLAVQSLGYAIAPAIWAGVGMITAFVLGATAFDEHIENIAGGCCSIVILSLGIYTMSSLAGVREDDQNEKVSASMKYSSTFWGFFFCVCNGLCDGAMMVPFKLSSSGNLSDSLEYVASFAISSAFVSPALFGMYCLIIGRIPDLHFKHAFYPGALSGALWCLANFMSVHATHYLGMKIGFPLTQTCIFFTTLWGILYFKEVDTGPWETKFKFSAGVFLLIFGAYILSSYG